MSMHTPIRAALAAGLFLAISTPSNAQTPQAAPAGDLPAPDIVLTPSRGPEAVARSGSSVSVIRAEEIAKAGIKSTADLFRSVPGAFVVEDGGPGQPSRVRLRGAEVSHTLVLIDGVRVNDPSNTDGHFDFANLIPGDIERIEVLRGPQSALYGSDAMGGVINIITRKGRGGHRGFAEAEGGSYGTLAGRAGISGGGQNFDYAVSISGVQADGFSAFGYRIPRITRHLFAPLDKDGYNRWGGMARFGWRPFEGVEIEAAATHTYNRAKFDSPIADGPNVGWGHVTSAHLKATHEAFDRRLRNALTLYGTVTDRHSLLRDYNTEYRYIGTRAGLSYQGDLALDSYGKLIFGGQIEREHYRARTTPDEVFFSFDDPVRASRLTRSAFVLYQLPIGERLDLSLGGRLDAVEKSDRFATWRATAAYRLPEWGTKFRASVGTGGKAPALDQLFNPDYGTTGLKSETSLGYEFGIDQALWSGRANIALTAFQNRYRDLIQFGLVGCRATQWSCYYNVGRAETRGIEAAGDVRILDDVLSARASYTYLLTEDEATHLALLRRPRHSATVSLQWKANDKLTIEPTLRLVGSRADRATNPATFASFRTSLAPYARLDVRADYQVHKNLNLYLRAENLTNARYQEVYNYGTTGRAFYAGARATW